MRFAPEYVACVLNENFEDAKALLLAPMMAINYAHLVMLDAQGIVPREAAHELRVALDGISLDAIRAVKYDGTCEDLFFYIERLLAEACGEATAGPLHTARPRNDIDKTMYRLLPTPFGVRLRARTLPLPACGSATATCSAAASCRRSATPSRSSTRAPSAARRSARRRRSSRRFTTRRSATSSTRRTTCSRSCSRCSATPRARSRSSPPR